MRQTTTASLVNSDTFQMRLVVYPGELYRLAQAGQRVRVTDGQAWMSVENQDVLLAAREAVQLPVSSEMALVSALGAQTLVLEVLN